METSRARTERPFSTKIMLHGMTEGPASDLAAISRSWESAPEPRVRSAGFIGKGYDPTERAYLVDGGAGRLSLSLNGSSQSPVRNVALVVRNWGNAPASLTWNGKSIPRGKGFRFGHRTTLEGTDLIVWVRIQSNQSMQMDRAPSASHRWRTQ